jgi:hypothetical protein
MTKCVTIAAFAVLVAWTAPAQDEPGAHLGYDYVRFNSASSVPAFSANSGSGQFIFNFNRWLGGVADLGAVHNNNMNGFQADTTIANFLFGPRVTLGGHRARFRPYFRVLWGGVYATSSARILGTDSTPSFPDSRLQLA